MKFLRAMGIGALSAILLVIGCQNDSQTTNTSTEKGVGRVAVLMTDAPTAPGTFSHIYLTVTGVSLLVDDDMTSMDESSSAVKLFEGEETIDLLNLTNHSEIFALTDVPAGDYEKIRLTVSKIELVKDLGDGTTESFLPQLTGNHKIDLNPRGTIHVEANATLIAQIDVDAEKSIHIVEKGIKDDYNFRPVIFVTIITDEAPGKLVRHSGYVDSLDAVAGIFNVCDTPLAERQVTDRCLVTTLANANVFAKDGLPAAAGALTNDQKVTAVGFLGVAPPSAATALVALAALHAEVVEIGGSDAWSTVRGHVGIAPMDALSSFTVLPHEATPVTAQLQNTTKVFARNGARLDTTAIVQDAEVAVDGVPDSMDAMLLKTSLVVVDTHAMLNHVEGIVLSVDDATHSLVVTTTSGDVAVRTEDGTKIVLVTKNGDVVSNEFVDFSSIKAGDKVTVYGHTEEDGSVEAETIVIDNTM